MVRATVDRLAPVCDGALVVTGERHARRVADQLAGTSAEVVAEPSPRDSMAAIGLAAAILDQRHGDVVVGAFEDALEALLQIEAQARRALRRRACDALGADVKV